MWSSAPAETLAPLLDWSHEIGAMVEAGVSAAIALIAGVATMATRLHGRITALDNRVDRVELRIVENYVTKADFATTLAELKSHMVRIEGKLDTFIAAYPKDR